MKSRLTSARKALDDATVRAPMTRHRLEAPRRAPATSSAPAASSTRSSIRRACGSRRRCRRNSSTRFASARPSSSRSAAIAIRRFEGRIERVSPAADPATRQVPIFVTIPEHERTPRRRASSPKAGSRARRARRWSCRSPRSTRTAGKPWVVRVRDGKAERVEVTLGLRDDQTERVEIASGVQAGDVLLLGAVAGHHAGDTAPRSEGVIERRRVTRAQGVRMGASELASRPIDRFQWRPAS